MRKRIRQLLNLRKLLWADERLNTLEARVSALQQQVTALDRRVDRRLNEHAASLKYMDDQLDLLKSSLDVPGEWIDEFCGWKVQHPIPAHPLVSVCVPTFNRAILLTERCIPSILSQTYENLELLIVGDGCTDNTEEAIAKFRDPRLRFINLSTRGDYPEDPTRFWMVAATAAVNKLLTLAQGDFITHLDDDDEYLPERIEKLVAFAVDRQCDFIWHPFWWEDPEGKWVINEALGFVRTQVTHSSVFYRSWFTRVKADINAHHLMEPGDWTRFRRIKYIGPASMRYPEPLVRHYRERNRRD